jgi:hypothetical protein
MAIIYKKTLKGVEEVALRSSGLQLRLRAYLILVDGTKSDDDIQAINASLPEVNMVLAALQSEGYLEIVGQAASAAPTFQQTVQQRPQQASPAPTFANTVSGGDNSPRFLEARDNMVREIMQLLGKDAEMVVSKIQRCENGMDLFAMMMGLKKIIGMYASNEKAEAFATKFAFVATL